MRIISSFKDYYDVGQQYGAFADDGLEYIREPRLDTKVKFRPLFTRYTGTGDYKVTSIVIGFCGKLYRALMINDDICYTIAQVDSLVEKIAKKWEVTAYKRAVGERGRLLYFIRRRHVKQFFEPTKGKLIDKEPAYVERLARTRRCPVFVYSAVGDSQGDTTFNCRLGAVEFFRIKDPYTAYQEIQMFMANLAFPNKPIPKVSDADMLEAKGFDNKFSFRKDKKSK